MKERAYPPAMIHDVAKNLHAALTFEDLTLLQNVLVRICALRGFSQTSTQAQESAKVLVNLYQSGIRNRHQLVAMLTGEKFP